MKNQRIELSIAIGLWALLALLGVLYLFGTHFKLDTVSTVYYQAAWAWLHGAMMYHTSGIYLGMNFIYAPQAAVLYVPFAILPFAISEIVWRIFFIAVFGVALYQFGRLGKHGSRIDYFFWMSLFTFPLAITIAHDGQIHLLLAGLFMLGLLAIFRQKLWWAAVIFSLTLALKPVAIVIYLLVLMLYPRVGWRMLVVTLLFGLGLFLTQHSAYVLQQYHAFVISLFGTAAVGAKSGNWAQLFGAIHFYSNHLVSSNIQYLLRIIFAGISLAACFIVKKRCSLENTLFFIFAISITYLMLFNPRTENNDYVMVMPVLGFLLQNVINGKKLGYVCIYIVMALALFCNHMLAGLISPHNNVWLKPTIVAALYLVLLIKFTRPTRDVVCL